MLVDVADFIGDTCDADYKAKSAATVCTYSIHIQPTSHRTT